MLALIALLTFIVVFCVVYVVFSNIAPDRGEIALRLKALDTMISVREHEDEELSKPLFQRIISPLTGSLAENLTKLTPSSFRRMVDAKIGIAGGFSGLTTDGFLLLSGFMGVAFALVSGILVIVCGVAFFKIILLLIAAFYLGLLLPLLLLNRKITVRKASIQKDLADVLDMITISVEAGLAFDGALAKLSEKMRGALVDEFSRLLQEMRIGVPRRTALHSLGKRCGVPDLSMFTAALIQADQLGVSIGNVLRVQAVVMREKRRQRAKEKAQKAPVKMLIPLVFFIFPAIFVVVVGPAVINIIGIFSHR